MELLKKLWGSKGLPKGLITYEETKKYNSRDYIMEPVEVGGQIKYKVFSIQKLKEKPKEQPTPAKAKKQSFNVEITRKGTLQGINNRMSRQQPVYRNNWRENVKPKHYKTFEQEENAR